MKHFLEHAADVEKELNGKEVFLFLDYDGTLTPIVATPDLAVLSEEMREAVRQLSEKYKVAVVSGRATDDVRSKVQLDHLFYAGSHGFEIVLPDGEVKTHPQAQEIRTTIKQVYKDMREKVASVTGALVEDVKYTISVHYRLVAEADFPKVRQAVEDVLRQYPNLRKTDGKKVFELRPNIDWDKGKAVEWILNSLKFQADKNKAVYIGDDTTDEDAFAVLEGKGFGLLVAEKLRPTKAHYFVRNVKEVEQVLRHFVNRSV